MAQPPTLPAQSHMLLIDEVAKEVIRFLCGQRKGVIPIKQVRVVATSALTITGNSYTVDSVNLSTGDRVLLTAQSSNLANGIYVATVTSTTMTLARDVDANEENDFQSGMLVAVGEGTVYGGTLWRVTTAGWPGTKTLGNDALVFAQLTTLGVTGATGATGPTLSVSAPSGVTVPTNATTIVFGTGLSGSMSGTTLTLWKP